MALYETWNAINRKEIGMTVEVMDEFEIKHDSSFMKPNISFKAEIDTFLSDFDTVNYRIEIDNIKFGIFVVKDGETIDWVSHSGNLFKTSTEAILDSIEYKRKRANARD